MFEKSHCPISRYRQILPLLLAAALPLAAQIPAFPGAEGFGSYAAGGRGGDVYYVTNLNNNGAGSLRVGLNTVPAAGRTIVFAVSGYIPVVSDTNFNIPSNVTIAGQTAPGDGVGLRGGRMLISGSDVIMRHFRIRHGKNGTGGDCLNIASSAQKTMLDHISLMFSTDENFSFFNSSVNNFTMQYSNSTWGMERHNAGGLWDLQNGSCHHTLWAHHRTRNPKARPNGVLEWVNNVTFHWRNEGFIMGDSQTPANWKANVRGCYYISIDDADDGSTLRSTGLTKATVASNGVPNFSLYLNDTLYDSNGNGILDGTDRGYAIVSGSEFAPGDTVGANRYYKSATPFAGATGSATITVDGPLTAYKKVVSSASPLRLDANFTGKLRDELDSLLVDSVVNQYSILVQKDGKVAAEDPARTSNGEQLLADQYGITNNGFGTLNGTTPPTDSDLDGMPDIWELSLNGKSGIAYNVAADDHNNVFSTAQVPNTFFPTGTPTGYTFLEEYLHFLAVPHATVGKNTTASPSVQTVNLAKYTSAFTNAASFVLTNVTNGSVQQFLADGSTPSATGPVVQFTPTSDFIGRAGFCFEVSDADGSIWKQQFALLVTGSTVPRDLSWIGGNAANAWDDTTSNWQLNSGATTVFSDGDTALFDDRGSNSPTINLQGVRVTNAMTITGTKNYSFTGPGKLTSIGTLTKAGETSLTLSTAFHFTGGTYLNGGETILNNGGNLVGGAIQFTGGSTLTADTGSNYLTISPDIKVSSGAVGNLNLAQRADLNGSLSGGGTFNINSASTINRVYFKGASADCTGTINLSSSNNGSMNFYANGGNFNGFNSGRVNLFGVRVFTHNNGAGNTYGIGSLGGDAAAVFEGSDYAGPTTLDIGGLGLNSTFAGVIKDGSDGNTILTHIIKSGAGTLTLSGTNTYSGATTVNAGKLSVTGSLGNTAVTVASGASLTGSGSLAGTVAALSGSTLSGTATISGQTTTSSGATVSPGDTAGAADVLTAAGGLSVTTGTLVFDISNSPTGNNDRISVTGGSGYVAGTNTFQVHFTDGVPGAGNYNLIDCAPGIPLGIQSGMVMNLVTSAPAAIRQSFGLNRTASGTSGGYIRLTVTNDAGSLVWSGGNGSTWDLNNNANFTGGPSGDNKFHNLDTVTFNDSAVGGTVAVNGILQPLAVLVSSAATNYMFDGSSGSIGGAASLTKSGNGTLTINSNNSYSGGTYLTGGILAVSGNSSLGTGPVHISGGTFSLPNSATFLNNSLVFSNSSAITSPYSGNSTIVNSNANTMTSVGNATVNLSGVKGILSVNGDMSGFSGTLDFGNGSGVLRLNSNSSAEADTNSGSVTTLFNLGTGAARISNRNGGKTIQLGAVEGGPGTFLQGRQSGSGATATTFVVGALNTDNTFAGTISQGGDDNGIFLSKVGTGTWTLSGSSSFTGEISVNQGTLALSGALTCSGSTYVSGAATLDLAGGSLTADDLEIAEGAILNGHGTIVGELLNNGNITIDSDTLTVTGTVVNNGTMRITGGAQLVVNQSFQNYGILDLLTAVGSLPPNLENFGVVIESSGLRITSAVKQGADFTVEIATYTGHTYQLERSDSLAPTSWSPVGSTVIGDGSVKSFTDTGGATPASGFYRIAVAP